MNHSNVCRRCVLTDADCNSTKYLYLSFGKKQRSNNIRSTINTTSTSDCHLMYTRAHIILVFLLAVSNETCKNYYLFELMWLCVKRGRKKGLHKTILCTWATRFKFSTILNVFFSLCATFQFCPYVVWQAPSLARTAQTINTIKCISVRPNTSAPNHKIPTFIIFILEDKLSVQFCFNRIWMMIIEHSIFCSCMRVWILMSMLTQT